MAGPPAALENAIAPGLDAAAMQRERDEETELEELAGYLDALGHPRRLELLKQLRVPRTVGEIVLRPWRNEQEGNPDRAITRTAVERHLALLRAIGVVVRRDGVRDGRSVDEYVLQHARLFQIVEELRGLTTLRPVAFDLAATVGTTPARTRAERPTCPHVVVLSGPFEGQVVPLEGRGPWTFGRSRDCTVALDHDAYASALHCTVSTTADGFVLRDLPTNRNGTDLEGRQLPRGGEARLDDGDIVRVGRSTLLFRAGAH